MPNELSGGVRVVGGKMSSLSTAKLSAPSKNGPVGIEVVEGDISEFVADVLIFKYAQKLHGADSAIVQKLRQSDINIDLPARGSFEFVESRGAIPAPTVLLVGVAALNQFRYEEIRDFARRSLGYLASYNIESMAFTTHGSNYGLDENESFDAQLGGILDAIESGNAPRSLSKVAFVELNSQRAARIANRLSTVMPSPTGDPAFVTSFIPREEAKQTKLSYSTSLASAGYRSESKPHVFVAMPFASEFEDTFYFGIQGASNNAGYLCERADLATFTGDVMEWVKSRIATAQLVVAEISSANPNVFLEIGFAWGNDVPTVLVAKEGSPMPFDIRGQRCLLYKSIRHLEQALTAELSQLKTRS